MVNDSDDQYGNLKINFSKDADGLYTICCGDQTKHSCRHIQGQKIQPRPSRAETNAVISARLTAEAGRG